MKMIQLSLKAIKILSLIILSVQTSAMVLILRYSRSSNSQRYIISTAVFLSEILKIVISLGLLLAENGGKVSSVVVRLKEDVIFNIKETSKLIVPAALYVIQNNLLFVALTNLDAATYQVTYQLKILTTALFSWVMLGRRLSLLHWISLSLLMIGVSLVQIVDVSSSSFSKGLPSDVSLKERREIHNEMSWFLGLLAVLISCVSSGFSGVYFERLVKRGRSFSLFVRNIQLGIFSILFCLVTVYGDRREISEGGFLSGYTFSTWAVIACQAIGGLIVAITMKYADNILKGFATSISIVMSAAISWAFLGDPAPTVQFTIGTIIVLGATFLYGVVSVKTSSVSTDQDSTLQKV